MADLIDRQTAIDRLRQMQREISGSYTNPDPMVVAGTAYIGECIEVLQDIPSCDPALLTDYDLGTKRGSVKIPGNMFEALSPAEPVNQWIPCDKELPEIKECFVSDPCLVYCSNGAYGISELKQNIFGEVWFECEEENDYYEGLGEVVAWIPLPEPYKGEEGGAEC